MTSATRMVPRRRGRLMAYTLPPGRACDLGCSVRSSAKPVASHPVKYRHVWPGVVLLVSLALLLAGLLIWGDHLLSPGPSGGLSRLLQHWSASRAPQGLRPIDPRAARPTAGGAPPSPEVSAGADRVIDPPRDRPPAVAL